MTSVALIQARMGSSRLPGKVLTALGGRPVLAWVVRAARATPGIDRVAVATSLLPDDDAIAAWCRAHGVSCHRGPAEDVLARFVLAARAEAATVVLRLTADCPLLDPHVCGTVLALLQRDGAVYAANVLPPSWPIGLDCEAFTVEALATADVLATRRSDREHVTPFLATNRGRFPAVNLPCPLSGLAAERWCLDYPGDAAFLSALVAHLPPDRPPAWTEVLAVLRRHPGLYALNTRVARDVSYEAQLRGEPVGPYFEATARPEPPPPLLTHSQGARVWDAEGHEYVDLGCGRGATVLGYGDADVNHAIRDQLDAGTGFGLPVALEAGLAGRLSRLIPCAGRSRFFASVCAARAAALGVARTVSGREQVVTWTGGALPDDAILAVTAALVVDAVALALADGPVLAGLAGRVRDHGALLVFDETVTGFRLALGGAQQHFGVVPDLAVFGEAMANGQPLAALVGRAAPMAAAEAAGHGGTLAPAAGRGGTLALAAAIATLDKMVRLPVIERLWQVGETLMDELRLLVTRHGLGEMIAVTGPAPWSRLRLSGAGDPGRRLRLELRAHGVLTDGATHAISYALNATDLARILAAYDAALERIAGDLRRGRPEP
jgi:glutamate-1-semialdehyde 2,1-aminomutase/spore coat polysaccharide biosynthesis protein SpsF